MLGARAAATLLPAAAAARAASLLAGALGGVIAAALIATVAVAGHAVPLPPTAQSGGIDLAAILGNAASGAIGGIVLSMLAGALFRAVRRR
jgi:hypothetical protein